MRPQDTLTGEPAALGDALRALVVEMGDELDPHDPMVSKGPPGDEIERLRRRATAPGSAIEPVERLGSARGEVELNTHLTDTLVRSDGGTVTANRAMPRGHHSRPRSTHCLAWSTVIASGIIVNRGMSGSPQDSAMAAASVARNGRRAARAPARGGSGDRRSPMATVSRSQGAIEVDPDRWGPSRVPSAGSESGHLPHGGDGEARRALSRGHFPPRRGGRTAR